MMVFLLILVAFQFRPLFDEKSPIEKRLTILKSHFKPNFDELATIDPYDLREKTDDPTSMKGYIHVRPPKGGCFILRKDRDQSDINICEPTYVPFEVSELDQNGRFQWTVFQGPNDPGTALTWQTPYRLANVIRLGNFEKGIDEDIPIASCQAVETAIQRKIILTLMNGKRWAIVFPDKDKLLSRPKKPTNLYVRIMTTGADGIRSTQEFSSTDGESDSGDLPGEKKMSLLALKLSGKYKEFQKKTYYFNIKKHGAYEANSAIFLENDAPMGMNGTCRYKFLGAPNDSESGVIECFNSESYDAIYMHLTCAAKLDPRAKDLDKPGKP